MSTTNRDTRSSLGGICASLFLGQQTPTCLLVIHAELELVQTEPLIFASRRRCRRCRRSACRITKSLKLTSLQDRLKQLAATRIAVQL
jgi:hypothetical protein